jgi:hypothetical protein
VIALQWQDAEGACGAPSLASRGGNQEVPPDKVESPATENMRPLLSKMGEEGLIVNTTLLKQVSQVGEQVERSLFSNLACELMDSAVERSHGKLVEVPGLERVPEDFSAQLSLRCLLRLVSERGGLGIVPLLRPRVGGSRSSIAEGESNMVRIRDSEGGVLTLPVL